MPRENKVPAHVGIIMDGNGRWAQSKGLPRIEGHRRGAERALEIVRVVSDYGVKTLTLYTFSLENWHRPPSEISLLMKLLETYLRREMEELHRENVRFRAIGQTWMLPENIQGLIRQTEEKTRSNTGLTLVAALSYGGRNEIVRAVRKALESGVSPEEITEEGFGLMMDTTGLPDPDFIIRTSGEIRLSNFLLWQSAYSELYFTPTLWPDFDRAEFERALEDYAGRDRRFGSVTSSKGGEGGA